MDKKLKIMAHNKNLSLFIDKFAGLLEQLTSGCRFAGEMLLHRCHFTGVALRSSGRGLAGVCSFHIDGRTRRVSL